MFQNVSEATVRWAWPAPKVVGHVMRYLSQHDNNLSAALSNLHHMTIWCPWAELKAAPLRPKQELLLAVCQHTSARHGHLVHLGRLCQRP
jgi:hypothetical protein